MKMKQYIIAIPLLLFTFFLKVRENLFNFFLQNKKEKKIHNNVKDMIM